MPVISYLKQDECQRLSDCFLLYKLKKKQPPASDRYIEYPWVMENLASIKKGKLLDIGSKRINLLASLLPQTVQIYAINLQKPKVKNNRIKFIKGDIRKTNFKDNFFDCVTCISTLEHIGVAGRYGSDSDFEGDIKAMKEIKRILKRKGLLLLTVPYGRRDILPINKLYSKKRIRKLFKDFKIINQQFFKFNEKIGVWFGVKEEKAAKADMLKNRWYALTLIKAIKK